ncbi:MAG: ABC transporter ATP-binding protein [Pseudaminobacter sp.]
MDVTRPKIKVSGLTARYPASEEMIIRDLSFEIGEGEVLTILGPNGVGKSTLLRCLSGFLAPTSGEVQVDGEDVGALSATERARRLALVSQSEQSSFALSVEEIVLTGRAAHLGMFGRPGREDYALAADALEMMGIGHLAERSFAELSGGERQLARIARALVQQSPVLILDEPTAHLDLANQMQVLKAILRLVERNCTVIATSHDPEHAFVCGGGALLLSPGAHRHGRVGEVLTEDNLSALYEVPLRLIESAGGPVVASDYSAARP